MAAPRRVGPLAVTAAVHRITWRMWYNDLSRSLGSKAKAKTLVIAILAAIAAWTAWSSVELGKQLGLDPETGREIAVPVASVMFAMPALATLMAVLYAPSRTLLTELLSVLPVREAHVRGATRWLTVAVGFSGGLLVSAPLALQFVFTGSAAVALVGVGYAVFAALLGCLATQVLTELAQVAAGRILGRNGVMVQGISGLLTAALLLYSFMTSMPMNGGDGRGVLLPLGEVLAWLLGATAPAWWVLVLVAASPVILLAALGLLEAAPRKEFAPWRPRLGGTRTAKAASKGPTFMVLELRQWLRYPPNAVLLLFINGLCAAAVVSAAATGGDELGVFYVALGVASAIGIGCYGPTRRHHWMYRVTGTATAWIGPKFRAVLLIWAGMMAVYGTAFMLVSGAGPVEFALALPMLFVELCASCALGLLLPVSRDQSIGGAVSEAVAVVGLLGLTFGLQSMLAASANLLISLAVQIAMMAAAYAWYLLTARWLALHRTEMASA
ncbi:hypothetical protein QFZ23_002386 [Arthrobacter globiformis]|uniref:hypothetical protein n=1 Tax=Arthrobacter globiformis TaxID=1665 RepID=UPI00277E4058|nr:hypothetical protein [Arthrobacter globiformis]MDQ1058485.1 hypothetical protein [Arthrobacter globiformis]